MLSLNAEAIAPPTQPAPRLMMKKSPLVSSRTKHNKLIKAQMSHTLSDMKPIILYV